MVSYTCTLCLWDFQGFRYVYRNVEIYLDCWEKGYLPSEFQAMDLALDASEIKRILIIID